MPTVSKQRLFRQIQNGDISSMTEQSIFHSIIGNLSRTLRNVVYKEIE